MTTHTMPDVARLITVKEAAERLGVHPKTVRRAITRGQLRRYDRPLDRQIYVDAEQVENLVRQRALDQRDLFEDPDWERKR